MANTVVASGSNASMDDLPLWLQATGGDPALPYTAANWRTALDVLFTAEGVIGAASFVVTQRAAGANFSVDVSAGSAIIQGDSVANQGKYLVRSVGVVNVAYTGGAPVSGTRIHRIIARLRDKQAAGADYDWTLEWLEDTGTGTPALPASAIHVALVSIASGQASVLNANITSPATHAQPYRGGPYRQSQILAAPAASITFSNVPNAIKTLSIRWTARGDTAAEIVVLALRLNGDTTGNYFGNIAQVQNGTQAISVNSGSTSQQVGVITASVASVGQFGGGVVDIEGLGSTTRKPNGQFRAHGWSTGAQSYSTIGGFLYNAVGHITSYTLLPAAGNFIAGSEFYLFGWE